MSIDREIARLARDQHGLVSVHQLEPVGGTRRHLARRAQIGQLDQVNHHVFRLAGALPAWESRVLAAVLSAGPGTSASHFTAAALWGLDGFGRSGRPEISVPRGQLPRPSDARCHTSTDLDRCTIAPRSGIPCTDLARTVLDVGRFVGLERLDRVVENSRRLHDLPVSTLVETLFTHARQGRHGIRKLRAILDRHLDRTEVTDSDFELMVIGLLAEHGFPAPVLHHEVRVRDVLIAEVDLAWPDQLVAAELHGRDHLRPEVWERDQVKLVELDALGWTVLPFTWRAYCDRRPWMLDRLRAALTA
jgi:hypothetical protein